MAITRRSLSETYGHHDAIIEAAQTAKREATQAYRQQLDALGMDKDAIKDEIDGFKKAHRRKVEGQKKGVENVEYRDAIADEIYVEITAPHAPRATRVEIIDEFPVEHDEDGVFPDDEQQPAPAARDLTVPQALTGQVAPIQTALSDAAFRDPLDWEDEDGAQAVANHTPEMATSGEAVVSAAAAVGASPTIREAEDIGSQPAGGENVAGHPSEDTVEKSDFVDDLTRAGATTSSDVEPVAPSNITQLRAPKPLRPNCLKPTMCGASGPVHCWSCVKALGEHQKAAQ